MSLPIGLTVSGGSLCRAGRGFVSLDIEVDEEEEVGCEERATEEGGTLSPSARAPAWETIWLPGRLRRKVRVSWEYDEWMGIHNNEFNSLPK